MGFSSSFLTMKLLILLIKIVHIDCLLDLSLIQAYFAEKSTRFATIFMCSNNMNRTQFKKLLNSTQRISIFDINFPQIDLTLKTPHNHISVVADFDCPNIGNLLITCGSKRFFDVKHHWLLITSSPTNLEEKFDNVTINIDADINLAIYNESIASFSIIDVYNAAARHGGLLNFTTIGFYDKINGFNARIVEDKYWARRNMSSVRFRTMVVLPVAFEGSLTDYLASDDNRTVNTFNRFHSRLVQFCRDYYNFSMDIYLSKSWGYLQSDGNFDGMVGALNRSEIDFGSSPLFVRTDRAKVIDYGRNTWILEANFIFRNPKSRTSIEIFLKPLSTSIWLITGTFALISVFILKIVTTYERKKFDYNVETTWSLSTLYTLGAFCQQGAPATPHMICGRITTLTILLLSLIIYQFYSASIVSHLLMKPATVIKNLRGLLESTLKVGCEDILYNRDYFLRTTDVTAKELYNRKILDKRRNISNFLPPEIGLHLVERGDYAFHVEIATAYPIIETTFSDKTICELREIQLFPTQPMHANYPKHSPFRDMLDTCLQRTGEYGILFRERKHWHPRKPECIQSSKSVTFNVGLDEFYPALVIYLIGVLISLILLIVEKQDEKRKIKKTVKGNKKKKADVIVPFVN